MRMVVQPSKPSFTAREATTDDTITAIMKRAIEGERKGLARNVEVVLVGEAPTETVDYLNAFCAALNRSLAKQWYECGRYLVSGVKRSRCHTYTAV